MLKVDGMDAGYSMVVFRERWLSNVVVMGVGRTG